MFVEAFYTRGKQPTIVVGRYGLSSKDTTPAHIIARLQLPKANRTKESLHN